MADARVDPERVAQMIAHRVCCGAEHDPANGKLHGLCVVCGVQWPCEYVGPLPSDGGPGAEFWRHAQEELLRAEKLHGPMNSLHEAYAVILEEVDELWEHCRAKRSERNATEIREELIQIAAMAARTSLNLGLEKEEPGAD